jgi:hypothetical protein
MEAIAVDVKIRMQQKIGRILRMHVHSLKHVVPAVLLVSQNVNPQCSNLFFPSDVL